MKKLFKRHYQSIVNRGLITENKTTIVDFKNKIREEFYELSDSITIDMYLNEVFTDNSKQESIDLVMTVLNMLEYMGVDIEKELIKNIELQEKRANEATN